MKAGTRTVTAAFVEYEPIPGRRRGEASPTSSAAVGGAALDMMSISGPFNAGETEDTPTRQRILICKPAAARDEEPCARKILATLARRAYRGFGSPDDVDQLLAIYRKGRAARDFDTGIARALEALLSSPKFLLRLEQEPLDAAIARVPSE